MRRIGFAFAILVAAGLVGWLLTTPQKTAESALPDHGPDPEAGERVFWAGGCASCHASPVDGRRARGGARLLLGGGLELDTPYGVFRVPNISSDVEDGIGAWSMAEFVNAMQAGVSPAGRHYYPSFPYTSYVKMPVTDVMDLKAFLDTLPGVEGRVAPHTLEFPWTLRRGIGLWKRLYLDPSPVLSVDASEPLVERGRALVEGIGHCGECHTPRDRFGGLLTERWLAGAPELEGSGRVPNITPAGKTISGWSVRDLVYYFESGFTPEFDTVGGSMVAVQENLAELPRSDLEAVAAYLKAVPAVE